MAAVVAGLFDNEVEATAAMDQLMNMHLHNLDTRLYGQEERAKGDTSGTVIPLVPNTGAPYTQVGGVLPYSDNPDWINAINDDTERAFYQEGLKEGATLAVAKVDDQEADRVRQIFFQHGARTYEKK